MASKVNTLFCDLKCPHCGKPVTTGIGFRVGAIANSDYKLGERLRWDGAQSRPSSRPDNGDLRTIGYFECENLKCSSWQDCYPLVQEVLITIKEDIISDVKPCTHKPNEIVFDIIQPEEDVS